MRYTITKLYKFSVRSSMNLYQVLFTCFMLSSSVHQASDVVPCIPDGIKGVLNEVWTEVNSPGLIKELTSDTRFPDSPSKVRILQTFNVPRNADNRYGQRMRAYVVAPNNGSYQFHVACNWKCEVYLSSGYDPADKKMILKAETYKDKTSLTIQMTRNKPYYLEALHTEYVGKDFLELKVKFPGTTIFDFIPTDYLIAYSQGNQSTRGILPLPGNWAPWSPCDTSCGIGHMIRHRSCAVKPPGIFLFTRQNSTTLALNETTSCAHRASCTGVKYFLTQSWQSCDQVCSANDHICARTGHDFPSKSALPIYKALNLTCITKSGADNKYQYPDHPAFYSVNSSSVGECVGYENIPKEINCVQNANPGATRICPCKPRPKFLGPPTNISAYNTSSMSIAVTWSGIPSVDQITGYQVTLNDTTTQESRFINCNTSTTFVLFGGLHKYRLYCVRVRVLVLMNTDIGNSSNCLGVTTDEDVPDRPPHNLNATANTSHSVIVFWDPVPLGHRHGVVIGYKVFYFSLNASSVERVHHNVTVPSTERYTYLSGLESSTMYCVQILAFTRIGNGNVSSCVIVKTQKQVIEGHFILTARSFLSPFLVKVHWKSQVKILEGLVVYKVITRLILDGNEDRVNKTASVLVFDKYANEYTINGLQPFSKIAIHVVAMGTDGPLRYSTTVIAETCRCPMHFISSWWIKPPYVFNSTEGKSSPEGLIPRTLSKIVQSVCGTCAENTSTTVLYKNCTRIETSGAVTITTMMDLSKQADFFFPVHKISSTNYVPFIKVPGIVLVTKWNSPATYARTLARSVFQCWPLVVFNIAMAFLAGVVTWLLESSSNRHHFPVPFVKGVREAFWWSFVTMTTVGYGDRVPKTIPARVFAVIWSLMGIILSSLLTSALTSSLIITVVTENLHAETGKRIAAVAETMEYHLVQQMTDKSENAISFANLEALFSSLEKGDIEAAMVDIHTAFFYKSLFFKSKFKITKVIYHDFTYGVLIGGEAFRLIDLFRRQLDMENTNIMDYLKEIERAQDHEFKGKQPIFTGNASIDFLDPSTELYCLVLLLLLSLLALGITGGLLYHVIRMKTRSRVKPENSMLNCYNSTAEEMRTMLQQFHQDIQNTYKHVKLRHRRELRNLLSIKTARNTVEVNN